MELVGHAAAPHDSERAQIHTIESTIAGKVGEEAQNTGEVVNRI